MDKSGLNIKKLDFIRKTQKHIQLDIRSFT